jgi:c-di-GMP-related signal transduction protein
VFSLPDALPEIPRSEVVAHLPIRNKMEAALRCEPNHAFLRLLGLAQCLEGAWREPAENMIGRLKLERMKVLAAFQESIRRAGESDSLQSDPAPDRN